MTTQTRHIMSVIQNSRIAAAWPESVLNADIMG